MHIFNRTVQKLALSPASCIIVTENGRCANNWPFPHTGFEPCPLSISEMVMVFKAVYSVNTINHYGY